MVGVNREGPRNGRERCRHGLLVTDKVVLCVGCVLRYVPAPVQSRVAAGFSHFSLLNIPEPFHHVHVPSFS